MNSNDDQLFAMMRRKLFTAVVGDILDTHGRLHQFLPAEIQPLRDDMVVVGRAMPVLEADLDRRPAGTPFGLMLESLDDLKRNEVYLVTGGSPTYSLWGELMSTRAMKLGAAGCVSNGPTRDTKGILALNFPTFSTGRYAQDQRPRGEVVDFRVPVQISAVRIAPGDIVFGDVDGVVIVPREIEQDVLAAALDKVEAENKVRAAIEAGVSAAEAFRRYGVM
ncbi:MAG TPA: RraA family protein [Bryobacteraceae bacterium]|nr:RraA family protein [Bryobacteraceae bacterium]